VIEQDTAVGATAPPAAEEKPQKQAAPAEAGKDFKLTMEAAEAAKAPQAAAEEPGPAAEAEGRVSLDFEGLDLSDLTPADDSETTGKGGDAKEESPLDLWALHSSADEDLSDLFDDLVPAGQSPKKIAPADEPSKAETAEGDKLKENDSRK
jgi:hypothetical protein